MHSLPDLYALTDAPFPYFKYLSYLPLMYNFVQDDYRLLVPDLRGFGSSTHPDDVKSSGHMGDMVSDMVCLLEKAGVDKAICIG